MVLLNGARQTGKSTLVQALRPGFRYLTLDDPVVLAAVKSDPFGFISTLDELVCLDEVQRAPELKAAQLTACLPETSRRTTRLRGPNSLPA